ncbi:MAG TPA: hypothetical protein VLB44_17580 [Kofleriaceae bacterium]|nr:hypothetical protein [Kofleriaceae bacterium]
MRAVLLSALLATMGCRIDLDDPPGASADANTTGRSCKVSTSTTCMDAAAHSDFAFINSKIFPLSCSASASCHKDATSSGKLDLSLTNAYAAIMGPGGTGGVMSQIDKSRVLVVPGQPKQSYFYFIIQGIKAADGDPPFTDPPSNVGFMPMSNAAICCQKIDAIERWITAGAMNN